MTTSYNQPAAGRKTTLQLAATVFGVVFLLVGILGFVPGITTHLSPYSNLKFAGHDHANMSSGAKLLGVFAVSILHNLVHVLFGVAGLLAARTFAAARTYFLAGGVIYLVLTLYGAVIDQGKSINFVPINTGDNWLHLVLGVAMIAIGVVLGRSVATARR
jgi:Domain of unknown function (DUF4383)